MFTHLPLFRRKIIRTLVVAFAVQFASPVAAPAVDYTVDNSMGIINLKSANTAADWDPTKGTSVIVGFDWAGDGTHSYDSLQYSTDSGTTWSDFSASQQSQVMTYLMMRGGSLYIYAKSSDGSPLALNTPITVMMRGVNGSIASPPSQGVRVTPYGPPGDFTNLRVTGVESGAATISFNEPPSNGWIYTYRYLYSTDNGATWKHAETATAWDFLPNPFTIRCPSNDPGTAIPSNPFRDGTCANPNSLVNGTTYQVRLKTAISYTNNGQEITTTQSAALAVTPMAPPSAPTNLVASPVAGAVSISFDIPSADSNRLTQIQYSTDGGTTWAVRTDSATSLTSPIVISKKSSDTSKSLNRGLAYLFKVRLISGLSVGTASIAVRGFTAAGFSGEGMGVLDRAALINSYMTEFAKVSPKPSYNGDLATCKPGTISQAAKNAQTDRLNWYRNYAGVPQLVYNPGPDNNGDGVGDWEFYSQSHATFTAAAGVLSHLSNNEIPQVLSMGPGYQKCLKPSTLAWTSATDQAVANADPAVLGGRASNISYQTGLYGMDDFIEDGSVSGAGHRIAFLMERLPSIAIGEVPAAVPSSKVAALSVNVWSSNASGATSEVSVRDSYNGAPFFAYPAPGYFPTPLLPWQWSITVQGGKLGNATVAMRDVTNNKDVNVLLNGRDNGICFQVTMCAHGGTIAWAPESVTAPSIDTTYEITISNIEPVTTADHCGCAATGYENIPSTIVYRVTLIAKDAFTPGERTKPTNLTGTAGDRTVTLSWDPPTSAGSGAGHQGYQVQNWWPGAAGWSALGFGITFASSGTEIVLKNGQPGVTLENYVDYKFRVALLQSQSNQVPASVYSDPISLTLVPSDVKPGPRNVIVTPGISYGNDSRTVNVAWDPPSGSESPTSYILQTSVDGGASWVTVPYSNMYTSKCSTTTQCTVAFNSYADFSKQAIFRVMAMYPVGTSAYTNGNRALKPGAATVPGAFTIDTVTAVGSNFYVYFTLPYDGGLPITSIEYNTKNSNYVWKARADGGGLTSPLVISTPSDASTNLLRGTEYAIKLQAINALGTGDYMLNPYRFTNSYSKPATPTGLSATPILIGNVNYIDVAFTPPSDWGGYADSTPNNARIQYSTDNGATWATRTDTSTVLTSPIRIRYRSDNNAALSSTETYTVRLRAIGSANSLSDSSTYSTASNSVSVFTLPGGGGGGSAASNDATLSALTVAGYTLYPAFSPSILNYQVRLPNSQSTVSITATTADSNASVTIYAYPATSGVAYTGLPVGVGADWWDARVTASDGITKKTYMIDFFRSAAGAPYIATPSGSVLNAVAGSSYSLNGSVFAAQGTGTLTYSASGLASGLSINTSTGTISGTPTTAGTYATSVTVRDSNNASITTYGFNIVVGQATLSTNANLSSISLSQGSITPSFSSSTVSYSASVSNSVNSLTLTPTTADSGATVKVNGITVNSGSASNSINLSVGSNVISVEVAAADTSTTKTYTFTITRAGNASISTPSGSALAGTYGSAYSLPGSTFSATGTGRLTYSVTGTLPTGLGLDTATGTISGTPTMAGTSSIVVNVTDTASATASTSSFNIVIGQAQQETLTVTSLSGTTASALKLTTSGGSGTGSVSFSAIIGTASGCSVSADSLTASSAGTCLVVATKASSTNYLQTKSETATITFTVSTSTLSTPDTPTFTATGTGTTASVTFASVSNASSYTAKLYLADGVTLIKTIPNFTSGSEISGLTAMKAYRVTITAIGDGTTFFNSKPSLLSNTATMKRNSTYPTIPAPEILNVVGSTIGGNKLTVHFTTAGTYWNLRDAYPDSANPMVYYSTDGGATWNFRMDWGNIADYLESPIVIDLGSNYGALAQGVTYSIKLKIVGNDSTSTTRLNTTSPASVARAGSLTNSSTAGIVTPSNSIFAGNVGVLYGVSGREFDAIGAGALRYSATGLPAGLTIDSTTGMISGIPTATGTSSVIVTVTDSNGSSASTAAISLVIGSAPVTQLVITSTSSQSTSGYQLTTSGGINGNTVSYAVSDLTATGCRISGTKLSSDTAGVCRVTAYMASAGFFDLASVPTNVALGKVQLTTPYKPTLSAMTGSGTSAILTFTPVSGATSHSAQLYQSNGTTPVGAVINNVTSGFKVVGLSFNTSYTIKITAVGDDINSTNSSPSIVSDVFTTSGNSPPVFVGNGGRYQVAESSTAGSVVGDVLATDSDNGTTLNYQLISGSGFAVDSATGQLTLTGTISRTGGVFKTVTISVTDGFATAQATFYIFVAPSDRSALSGVTRYKYSGITGTTISSMTSSTIYTTESSTVLTGTQMIETSTLGDNFGLKYLGYLIPSITGSYKFWVSADASAQLFLGTSPESGTAATAIVDLNTAIASPMTWSGNDSQASSSIQLVKGQIYYIKALMKEGIGADHFGVVWQGPGMSLPADSSTANAIPLANLKPISFMPDWTTPGAPRNLRIESISGNRISVIWNASSDDVGIDHYDIWRDGTKISSVSPSIGDLQRYVDTPQAGAHTYNVFAYDFESNVSESSTVSTTSFAASNSILENAIASGNSSQITSSEVILTAIRDELATLSSKQQTVLTQIYGSDTSTAGPIFTYTDKAKGILSPAGIASSRAFPIIVANYSGASLSSSPKSLAVAGWTESGSRFAAFGDTPFTTSYGPYAKRTIAWLISNSGSTAASTATKIAVLDGNYATYKTWLTGQGIGSSSSIVQCSVVSTLATCFSNQDLIIVNDNSATNSNTDATASAVAAAVKAAAAAGIPILYIHGTPWGYLTKTTYELSAILGFQHDGYPYYSGDSMDYSASTMGALFTSASGAFLTPLTKMFDHFYARDWDFDMSTCEEKTCSNSSVLTSLYSEFLTGAGIVRKQTNALDQSGTDLFSTDSLAGGRLFRLEVLYGDLLRRDVRYPVSKARGVNQYKWFNEFYGSSSILNFRKYNEAQADLGSYDGPNATPNTPKINVSPKFDVRKYTYYTATGFYALPGQSFTVRRLDTSSATMTIRLNSLRENSTKWFNDGENYRPKYPTSPNLPVRVDTETTITSALGGPIFIYIDAGVETESVQIQLKGVARGIYWASPADTESFAASMNAGELGWVQIVTPAFEINSTYDKMKITLDNLRWSTPESLSAVMYENFYQADFNMAGFIGPGLSLSPEVQAICNSNGWTAANGMSCTDPVVHGRAMVIHENADSDACLNIRADACSGNPFDSDRYFDPIGWAEHHEMGHNVQLFKFSNNIAGEASNNIFALFARYYYNKLNPSKYTLDDFWGPDYKDAQIDSFKIVQPAALTNDTQTVFNKIWVQPLDYAGLRIEIYQQLLGIAQMSTSPYPIFGENGWDFYTAMYLNYRMFNVARDASDAIWDARRANLGFSNFSRAAVQQANLKEEDRMLIAASFVLKRDLRDFWKVWGLSYSDTASAQLDTFGFTRLPKQFYVRPISANGEYQRTYNFVTVVPLDGSVTALPKIPFAFVYAPNDKTTITAGTALTLTAPVGTTSGAVTFKVNGLPIVGCTSKSITQRTTLWSANSLNTDVNQVDYVATCSWTPTVAGTYSITADVTTTQVGYSNTSTPVLLITAVDSAVLGQTPSIESDSDIQSTANPSVIIKSSGFKPTITANDFMMAGSVTGITISSVNYLNANRVTLNFSGTPSSGLLTITAKPSAFSSAVSGNSNTFPFAILGSSGTTGSTSQLSFTTAGNTVNINAIVPAGIKNGKSLAFSVRPIIGMIGTKPAFKVTETTEGARTLDKPFKLQIPNLLATAGIAPGYAGSDGIWKKLKPISGTVNESTFCSSSSSDGYKVDSPTTITIFSCHLTTFGYQTSQAPVTVTSNKSTLNAGETATLSASGGSGTGVFSYATSSSSSICTISGNIVTAVGGGACILTATKDGDVNYLSETSDSITVTVGGIPAAKPVISTQPLGATKSVGQSYRFTVSASISDAGTLSYQWLKNGTAISGATSDSFTITTLLLSDSSTYSVRVTNTLNTMSDSTVSNSATLVVNAAPTITTPTTGLTGTFNSSYSLQLSTTGTAPKSLSSTGLPAGLTLETTTGLISGTPSSTGSFAITVTVTDGTGAMATSSFTITIDKAAQAPLSITSTSGSFGTALKLITTGGSTAGAISYSITAGGSAAGCLISNGDSLTSTSGGTCLVVATMAGNDSYTAISSSVTTITLAAAALATPTIDSVTALADSASAIVAFFSSVANASSYQAKVYLASDGTTLIKSIDGYTSGTAISGLVASTAYKVTIVAIGNVTSYSNSSASALSQSVSTNAAAVKPTITTSPTAGIKSVGQSYTFSIAATASDSGTLSYQWKKSGSATVLSTTSSLALANLALSDSATYTVLIFNTKNGTSASDSATATLVVNAAPTITTPNSGLSGIYNQPYTLSISSPAGSAPKSFEIASGSLGGGLVLDTSTGIVSGTPTAAASYTLSVTVTDVTGATSTTSPFTITINKANQVALTVTSTTGSFGTALKMTASGGSTSGSISYVVIAGTAASCSITSGDSLTSTSGGTCLVVATRAGDSNYNAVSSDTTTVTLSATPLSTPSTPSAVATADTTTAIIVTYTPVTNAVSHTTRVYLASDSTTLIKTVANYISGAVISGLSPNTTYKVTITAIGNVQSYADSAESAQSGPVTTNPVAGAPTIGTNPTGATKSVGQSITFTSASSSPDGGILSYQWKKNGVAISNATSDSYTIPALQLADSATYTITVSNLKNGTTTSSTSTGAVLNVNAAPTIVTPTAGLSGTYNNSYTLNITSSGTSPKSFALASGSLGGGLTLDTATGRISGTPTAATSYTIALTVTDGTGATATTSAFTIDINKTNQAALTVTSTSGSFGTPLKLVATGGSTAGNITYSVSSGSASSCAIVNGDSLTSTSGGTCLVVAIRPGDSNFNEVSSTPTTVNLMAAPLSTPSISFVAATAETVTAITVTYSSVANAVSYTAKVYLASDGTTLVRTVTGFASGSSISGLTANTAYKVTITAIGDVRSYSDSAESGLSGSVTTNPSAGTPSITLNPTGATKSVGQSKTFTAAGNSPDSGLLSYQWRKNGVAISGATYDSYTITSLQLSDSATYTFTVTNTKNGTTSSTTSSGAALNVYAAPTIATPGTGLTGTYNSSYSLTLNGTGTSNLVYAITSGSLGGGLSMSSAGIISGTPTTAASYTISVTVTDGTGATATTSPFTITINKASQAALTVTSVSGIFGTPLALTTTGGSSNGAVSFIATTGSAGCSITNGDSLTATRGGTCSLTATMAGGANYLDISSAATMISFAAAQLAKPAAPTITAVSNNSRALTATFSVDSRTVSYTARVYTTSGILVGAPIANFLSGETITGLAGSTTYKVTITAIGDGTNYSSSQESSFSTTVTTVADALTPTISTQPAGATKSVGQSITLNVSAVSSDAGVLSYQWRKGGAHISGATSSSLVLTNLNSGSAGDYSVIITNSKNSTTAVETSTVATLVVNAAATIITPTSGLLAKTGQAYTLTIASPTGTAPKRFALASGTLGGGLSLDTSTGVISGTPTVPDTYTITVAVTDATGSSDTTTAFSIGVIVPVASILITTSLAPLAVPTTRQLSVAFNPESATVKTLLWTTSNPAVATVSETGTVTAISAGTATITATSVSESKTATYNVTVYIPVIAVAMKGVATKIAKGFTNQIAAAISPSDATTKTVFWSSSDTSVAAISSTGLITAIETGTAVITVRTLDETKTATTTVSVLPNTFTVSGGNRTLTRGGSNTVTILGGESQTAQSDLMYYSSDTSVATVNGAGTISAIAAGIAVITATNAGETASASLLVTVEEPAPSPAPAPSYGGGGGFVAPPFITTPVGGVQIPTEILRKPEQVTAEVVEDLSKKQVSALPTEVIAKLPAAAIGALTDTQIKSLSPTQVAALGAEQAKVLAPAQVAALAPVQVAALAPEAVASLSTTVIASLSKTQVKALEAEQVAALEVAQIKALPADAVKSFAPAQLAAITPEAMPALPVATIAALTTTQVKALTPDQIAEFRPAQVKVLSVAQVQSLTKSQVASIPVAAISVMTTTQVSMLKSSQVNSLTVEQTAALTVSQIKVLTPTLLAAIAPAAIAGVSPKALAAVAPAAVARMSTTQLSAMTKEQSLALTLAQRLRLTPRQLIIIHRKWKEK